VSLFADQSARMLSAVAADLGCDIGALASHFLTVVPGPPTGRNGIVVRAVDTGMGTVLSVAAPLVEWARANAPTDGHYRALQPFFLAQLAERARIAGFEGARADRYLLGFALAQVPETPTLPAGFRLAEVDAAWMARYRPSTTFENALGDEEHEQTNKTQVAFAALDEAGEPAAVAGIWYEPHDRHEIGVEVRRESRGLGLARVVVTAATAHALAHDAVPSYSCPPTNIRSQRNALACGFLPLYATAMVRCPAPA
jgi:RimJ/RimL family protein N-acetyltransferase